MVGSRHDDRARKEARLLEGREELFRLRRRIDDIVFAAADQREAGAILVDREVLSREASNKRFPLITRRAVGIAAMNALADTCWRRRPHPESELRFGIDAFDATEIRSGDTVVAVGAAAA